MARADGRPGHFLRAWRKHRGYTLESVAERLHMSHQNLGKIERGKVPYNQDLLERLAEEYRCAPPDLLMRDPSDPEGIWSVWDNARAAERQQIVSLARVVVQASEPEATQEPRDLPKRAKPGADRSDRRRTG